MAHSRDLHRRLPRPRRDRHRRPNPHHPNPFGSSVPFVTHRLGHVRSEAVEVADFNRDGRLDIVAAPRLPRPDWRAVKIRSLAGEVNDEGKGYFDDF
ncbi:MAG: hypothetical protein HS113_03110 [Verrucomicrobiales bacterium]|nr:hypothetical protein [Verrucomicrobiales bacterium]